MKTNTNQMFASFLSNVFKPNIQSMRSQIVRSIRTTGAEHYVPFMAIDYSCGSCKKVTNLWQNLYFKSLSQIHTNNTFVSKTEYRFCITEYSYSMYDQG